MEVLEGVEGCKGMARVSTEKWCPILLTLRIWFTPV